LISGNAAIEQISNVAQNRDLTSWQAALPQVSLQKSLVLQKLSLDLKKLTRFKISALKLTVLLEII